MNAQEVAPAAGDNSHAIVVGGSMVGLVTAAVLSTRFRQVTVLDRDTIPDGPVARLGVPQGRHGHGILASGLRGLERLFPGIESELREAGAVPGDVVNHVRWFQHGYYKVQFRSGLDGLLLSRPLLEKTVRLRAGALPNVRLIDDTHVLGFDTDAAKRVVTGVRARTAGRQAVTLAADLVVDASGRGSRTPEWLAALGYDVPPVDEVRVGLGYTSRILERRRGDLGGDLGVIIAPTPPDQLRGGFAFAMEGNRWIIGLCGWMGDHAPTDPTGYIEFARSLNRPDIYDLLQRARPLSDPIFYAYPANLRRHYERLTAFPERLLVIGDALCSFNPIYGQGMSVGTLEALALADRLAAARTLDGLWRPFFKAAARIIDTPWTIAAGSDFAFRGVTGPRPAGTGFINWYMAHVHRVASFDEVVARAFFNVANLLAPPPTLFHPRVVARVTKGALFPPHPARTSARHPSPRDARRSLAPTAHR